VNEIATEGECHAERNKPQGRAGHLSAEQKQAIRLAYLETGGTIAYAELGRRCTTLVGREVNRETVAACLKGPEYDALRKHFDTEIKASAIERLKAGILPAADAWVKAIDNAAGKGDHKPAKDLLMHTGTIEPLDDDGRARGPLVLVLTQDAHGQKAYRDGNGMAYDLDPATGEVLNLPKNTDVMQVGIALPGIKLLPWSDA